MNTKNNKRKRESQEKIMSALYQLVNTKSLDSITVTDLCKTAGVNRSTFYSSYEDIYDLYRKSQECLEQEAMDHCCQIRDGWIYVIDFEKLFTLLAENPDVYQNYMKFITLDNMKPFRVDPELSQNYFKDPLFHYHLEFFRAGITRIVKLWLGNGCKESPKEMLQVIQNEYKDRALPENVRLLYNEME